MSVKIISETKQSITLEVVINFDNENFLQTEERIMNGVNEMGKKATQKAMENLDINEQVLQRNKEKLYAKKKPKKYKTPYGEIEVNRKVFAPLKKGKQYCPVEKKAYIIKTATPKLAKLVSNKYIHMSSKFVQDDLQNNHNLSLSQSFIQILSQQVSNKLQAQEANLEYTIPTVIDKEVVATISIGLDGTCMPMGGSNWREAMCGTISLYDKIGIRLDTIYVANAPEYGKKRFKERMNNEILDVKKAFPNVKIVGVADGAQENWKFLSQYTESNTLDFYHATEYLSKASKGVHPRSQEKQNDWFTKACTTLKNVATGAKDLLEEITKLQDKKLPINIQKGVDSTITYFNNNLHRMNYKNSIDNNLPIGSGVTESACKILVKQRVCISRANWSEYGAKRFLPIRAIVFTDGRWNQVWDKLTENSIVA